MQSNRCRFLLYWLGLWLCISPLTCLFVNTPSPEASKAFWNLTVWVATIPVAGGIAWLLYRYQAPIKTVLYDRITICFLMAGVLGNQARNGWASGVRHDNALYKTAATVIALVAMACLVKSAEESVKRLRAWRTRRALPDAARASGRSVTPIIQNRNKKMPQDKCRFLLCWLGLWVVLAPLVSMLMNPHAPDVGKALWNPLVWGAMVSVSYFISWLICRYGIQVLLRDSLTQRLQGLCFAGLMLWSNWGQAVKTHDTVRKSMSLVFGGFLLFMFVSFLREVRKRLRAWSGQSAP